jgi:arsenate reductase (glutaredoxin)
MDYFLYLSSCTTCKRIMGELSLPKEVILIDIKKEPLTEDQLAYLYHSTGSHLDLINKRAQLFKSRKIDPQKLTEEAAKDLLLEHYTFLKRPVLVYRDQVYVGHSKAVVADAKKGLDEH